MLKKTALHGHHQALGALLIDFAGWEMPMHYGSQIKEHHAVRQQSGMFDVSHMGVFDVTGADATAYLRHALANDIYKLQSVGQALYTCLLNPMGGVIDDLIVYRLGEDWYRIILNASRCEIDVRWFEQLSADFDVTLKLQSELNILAVQGPNAISQVKKLFDKSARKNIAQLKPFHTCIENNMQIARTGYTGEEGVEIILSSDQAVEVWEKLLANNVAPCGLGARDTLRLEAGFNLFGNDMDENITPFEANLSWTVSFKDEARDFVGKSALLKQQEYDDTLKLVGLIMEAGGVLRNQQIVYMPDGSEGEITSGGFSPTLGHAIAFARVPNDAHGVVEVDRRGKRIPVKIVKLPFVKHGQAAYQDYQVPELV